MNLEERLHRMERGVQAWKAVCVVQTAILVVVVCALLLRPLPGVLAGDGILHARGLVITDNNGRARVVMGAPLPDTKERLRKDSAYAAMVFLDEQGHDRISLGQDFPRRFTASFLPIVTGSPLAMAFSSMTQRVMSEEGSVSSTLGGQLSR